MITQIWLYKYFITCYFPNGVTRSYIYFLPYTYTCEYFQISLYRKNTINALKYIACSSLLNPLFGTKIVSYFHYLLKRYSEFCYPCCPFSKCQKILHPSDEATRPLSFRNTHLSVIRHINCLLCKLELCSLDLFHVCGIGTPKFLEGKKIPNNLSVILLRLHLL